MKKGISLIVLVITIIVMIIIAGAIIVSLSQNNIVDQATTARDEANLANARAVIVAAWADSAVNTTDGKATLNEAAYYQALVDAKLATSSTVETIFDIELPTVTVEGEDGEDVEVYTGGCPTVEYVE